MANEWKRSTWSFQPITLSHTYQHIINAIHTALIDAGWVLASWSGALGNNNYYMRPDRLRCDFESLLFGPSGNQSISVVGANLSAGGMSGGAFDVMKSTKAAGWVQFSGIPADGNTVTVNDGTTTKTFEFETTGGVVSGNVPVAIGPNVESTIENLAAAVASVSGFKVKAAPHWHWWYTGDNYYQHGVINVRYNASPLRIEICSGIENTTQTALQRVVTQANRLYINYDTAVQNDFTFICGEDGFYVEGGTNGSINNIAHGVILAFYPTPEFEGTRDRERTWAAQGATLSLLGNIPSENRNQRFVEAFGEMRNHTGRVVATTARGTNDCTNRSIIDDRTIYVVPRDHMSLGVGASYITDPSYVYSLCTLGLLLSSFDDLYRISPMSIVQCGTYSVHRDSSGSEVTGAGGNVGVYDARNGLRTCPKFAVCSSYLLAWNNITDRRTGVIYRVARVVDGGRNSNIGIQWPDNSNVTTIPATP